MIDQEEIVVWAVGTEFEAAKRIMRKVEIEGLCNRIREVEQQVQREVKLMAWMEQCAVCVEQLIEVEHAHQRIDGLLDEVAEIKAELAVFGILH
jgi:hypothetical protein